MRWPKRRPPTSPHVQREMDAADVFTPPPVPVGARTDRPSPMSVDWSPSLPVCATFGCIATDGVCCYCGVIG